MTTTVPGTSPAARPDARPEVRPTRPEARPQARPRSTSRWLLRRTADAMLWTLIAMGCGMSGLGNPFILPLPAGRDDEPLLGPRQDGDRR